MEGSIDVCSFIRTYQSRPTYAQKRSNSLLSNWVFHLINKHPWLLLHPHTQFLNIFRFSVHLGGRQWAPHNNTRIIKIFQKKIFNFGTRDSINGTSHCVYTLRALVVMSRMTSYILVPLFTHSLLPMSQSLNFHIWRIALWGRTRHVHYFFCSMQISQNTIYTSVVDYRVNKSLL